MSTAWWPHYMERRRNRVGATFRPGMRVEVLGPFGCRTGPGTIRKLTATHRSIIVDLDSGKDVCVGRGWARPLTADTSPPT